MLSRGPHRFLLGILSPEHRAHEFQTMLSAELSSSGGRRKRTLREITSSDAQAMRGVNEKCREPRKSGKLLSQLKELKARSAQLRDHKPNILSNLAESNSDQERLKKALKQEVLAELREEIRTAMQSSEAHDVKREKARKLSLAHAPSDGALPAEHLAELKQAVRSLTASYALASRLLEALSRLLHVPLQVEARSARLEAAGDTAPVATSAEEGKSDGMVRAKANGLRSKEANPLSSGDSWFIVQDAHGRTYYANEQTNETTWELPTDASCVLGSWLNVRGTERQAEGIESCLDERAKQCVEKCAERYDEKLDEDGTGKRGREKHQDESAAPAALRECTLSNSVPITPAASVAPKVYDMSASRILQDRMEAAEAESTRLSLSLDDERAKHAAARREVHAAEHRLAELRRSHNTLIEERAKEEERACEAERARQADCLAEREAREEYERQIDELRAQLHHSQASVRAAERRRAAQMRAATAAVANERIRAAEEAARAAEERAHAAEEAARAAEERAATAEQRTHPARDGATAANETRAIECHTGVGT